MVEICGCPRHVSVLLLVPDITTKRSPYNSSKSFLCIYFLDFFPDVAKRICFPWERTSWLAAEASNGWRRCGGGLEDSGCAHG